MKTDRWFGRIRSALKRVLPVGGESRPPSSPESALLRLETRLMDEIELNRLLSARLLVRSVRQMGPLPRIAEAEFKVFSQWGEDGIIQYLLGKVEVPNRVFVEFGVQDYRESNTRFLLINDNWSGLLIECNSNHVNKIKQSRLYWRHSLSVLEAFVTSQNINSLIEKAGITGDIGLLSIDIDGNDYWVWEAIDVIAPRIVVVEYNSVFGKTRAVTVPYAENFERRDQHYSMMFFGASLKAFCHLARKKGYRLAGSNSAGSNAFFVRNDVAQNVPEVSCEQGYVESKFRDSRDINGSLSYLAGRARLEAIRKKTVYDLELQQDILVEKLLE